jgi:hypothetical protein
MLLGTTEGLLRRTLDVTISEHIRRVSSLNVNVEEGLRSSPSPCQTSMSLCAISQRQNSTLLSSIPSNESRIMAGLVERRTVHANVIWCQREMMMKERNVYFSRPDSKLVSDNIPEREIISVGRVDILEGNTAETRPIQSTELSPIGTQLGRRVSLTKNDSDLFQDFQRKTFVFEVKMLSGTFYRSHFVRVYSLTDCDDWIERIPHRCRYRTH